MEWMTDINVWGVVHGCRAFLPLLREADEAHIVNVSSMAGLLGFPQNVIYSMTKGAVRSFSEGLRSELIGTPIGVTVVMPGAIDTNIISAARGTQAARLASQQSNELGRRLLTRPSTVARRIVDGIRRDRARVVVGPDAHLIDLSARLLPGRSGLIGRAVGLLDR
ncbi:MAG: SDR family NAD(P)-dependent oxidoreductase [Actinobacteria bacterium]|nr:SDR family NAD(P)-dependent oxidoreductase [Actinomycetota bacterium]